MERYLENLLREKAELSIKICKIEYFLSSYRFQSVDEDNQALLKKQLEAMQTYEKILAIRIEDKFHGQ